MTDERRDAIDAYARSRGWPSPWSGEVVYHGTLRRHVRGIRAHGLIPRVGPLTCSTFGDLGPLPRLVYAHPGLNIARAAIESQLALALKKKFRSDVTDGEIRRLGAIVVAPSAPFIDASRAPGPHPPCVEWLDWYTAKPVPALAIIVGDDLDTLFAMHDLQPRNRRDRDRGWPSKVMAWLRGV